MSLPIHDDEDLKPLLRAGKMAQAFCICFGFIAPTLMLASYVY